MANVNTSPNMNLPVPIPTQDPGPDWANNIYACLFNVLDQHNHSSGSGVQINPDGLNINSDLSFLSNNAITLRSTRYATQGAPLALATDLGCIYVSGVDLYYNDVNGNQIRITSGGSVNATSSGISSGTATASFVSGTLVVDSAVSTPGNIQVGSVLLGNNTAGSDFITLSPPTLTSNYNLVLPQVPTATSFLQLDNSGNITASIPVTLNKVISSSCGSDNTTNTSFTSVLNWNNALTTIGKPVVVQAQNDGTGNASFLFFAGSSTLTLRILRDGTEIGRYSFQSTAGSFGSGALFNILDTPSAGSHTYTAQFMSSNGTQVGIQFYQLVTYELP